MKMERDNFGSSFMYSHPSHQYHSSPPPAAAAAAAAAFTPNSHAHDEPNLFYSSIFNANDGNLLQQSLLPYLLPSQSDDPSCFNFFTQDYFPSNDHLHLRHQFHPPVDDDLHCSLYSSSLPHPHQLPPKIPHPNPHVNVLPHDSSSSATATHFFHHSFSKPLPDLQSLQQPLLPTGPSSSSSSTSRKRNRLDLNLYDSTANNPQTLRSVIQSFNSPPSPPPPSLIPHSKLSRKGRQTLGDKTRCLQKLMPWDKKMDTGTMLQEAYKYIGFLQAQVSILQSMPISSSFASTQLDFAGLGKLNRQQLLQVLVSSPVAQTMLSSRGFCVFASEQLVSLNKAKERNTVLQQFFFGN